MDFESIKIAFLAGDIATVRPVLRSLGPSNPIVVTDCEGKAIYDVD
jgi:hypothetical protein